MILQEYLAPSKYIDFQSPLVAIKAMKLARESSTELDLVNRSFQFVRDQIKHSWDARINIVTCRASEVIKYGTGYCYAKSHLLAALLRANGIPTGLCYQRLSVNGVGSPYCLHGLNAVLLEKHGWYRLDARGNKPGIVSEFCPPVEMLAFPIQDPSERDLPEIWSEPLTQVTQVLETYRNINEVRTNLPDVLIMPTVNTQVRRSRFAFTR